MNRLKRELSIRNPSLSAKTIALEAKRVARKPPLAPPVRAAAAVETKNKRKLARREISRLCQIRRSEVVNPLLTSSLIVSARKIAHRHGREFPTTLQDAVALHLYDLLFWASPDAVMGLLAGARPLP